MSSPSSTTICICPDSFKGTLDSVQVCANVEKGVLLADEKNAITFDHCPMSDGGRGFMASATAALKKDLEIFTVKTVDPYFDEKSNPKRNSATFGMTTTAIRQEEDGKKSEIICIVETAEACGIHYPPPTGGEQRNPLKATSFGVGELLKVVLEKVNEKVNKPEHQISRVKILIGLGGSATNDGGLGCLQSLGVKFINTNTDDDVNPDPASQEPLLAEALTSIKSADVTGMSSYLESVSKSLAKNSVSLEVILVSDVTNPLLGPNGATAIYGPQKGAKTEEMRQVLEDGIANLETVLTKSAISDDKGGSSSSYKDAAGAGAAGGLGGALIFAFRNHNIKVLPGADTFSEMIQLERRIADTNTKVVVSGEGSFDSQTIQYGKTVAFVASICKKHNKPLIVVCGICDEAAAKDAAARVPPVLVASTVKKFGKEASLANPAGCLENLSKEEVAGMIQSLGERNISKM